MSAHRKKNRQAKPVSPLGQFIRSFAKKTARIYPRGYSDENDYIQTGYLALATIIKKRYAVHDFDKYARTVISRAIRGAALNSMCVMSAPLRDKTIINNITRLLSLGMTEDEICIRLRITHEDFVCLEASIRAESWHRLPNQPTCDTPQFSVLDDILSSNILSPEEVEFVRSRIDGTETHNSLSRKQEWSKMQKIRLKLTRGGYGSKP